MKLKTPKRPADYYESYPMPGGFWIDIPKWKKNMKTTITIHVSMELETDKEYSRIRLVKEAKQAVGNAVYAAQEKGFDHFLSKEIKLRYISSI